MIGVLEMQVSGFPSALHLAFSRGILHEDPYLPFLQCKTFSEVKAEEPTNIAEEGSMGAYQAHKTSNKQPHLITIPSHFVLARSDLSARSSHPLRSGTSSPISPIIGSVPCPSNLRLYRRPKRQTHKHFLDLLILAMAFRQALPRSRWFFR